MKRAFYLGNQNPQPPIYVLNSMKITGTIVYNDFEGGFWGIKSDDGREFLPVTPLPEAAKVAGVRIKAEVEVVQAFSIFMWGETVKINSISLQ